ncbi:hypothetical protein [Roseicyclus marinus]|uniref:hypothetical protein n=1 Tax=Roseicyclus marinus TaxID=2161673 RepID=UPI00240F8D27|nr:hypothetical protein [Roseicyclus marinus]MDG3041386.1 hypothetical protein [Roseicyclus marinus]
MRWSCSDPLSRALALVLFVPFAAEGQTATENLRALDPPDPVVTYSLAGQDIALHPWDILAVELSESGGITDIFLRLTPEAASTLAALTGQAMGGPFIISLCGHVLLETRVEAVNDTGTLYLPDTNAARGEALRALWQGRARCDRLGPEVFPDGQ